MQCLKNFLMFERQHVSRGGAEREREREGERISSMLHTVSGEAKVGLNLMNHEIMTWAEIKSDPQPAEPPRCPKSFIILALKSLIYFELTLYMEWNRSPASILLHVDIQWKHVLCFKKTAFSPLNVWKWIEHILWGFVSGLSVPLVCTYVLMPVSCCFDYCTFIVSFEMFSFQCTNPIPSCLIPKYFILFDVIVNGIDFLISFLVVHWKCIEYNSILSVDFISYNYWLSLLMLIFVTCWFFQAFYV